MIRLSFIIPCLNSAKTIVESLNAILASDLPRSDREIIVVDNGSTDETVALARLPGVTVVHCEKRGAAAARNYGAQRARGIFFAFIDSDTAIEPDWAKILLEKMEEMHFSASLGRVIPTGAPSFLTGYRRKLSQKRYAGTNISLFHYNGISPVINTAACMVKRTTFEAIGGFDERLERFEDTEFSWRLFQRGGTIYGTMKARAHVSNPNGSLSYLKRSLFLGKGKWNLAPLMGQGQVRIFFEMFRELLDPGVFSLSWREIGFYILNFLASVLGFLSVITTRPPTPRDLKPALGTKLLSLFVLKNGQGEFELERNVRLIVVDETCYFYSHKSGWKTFESLANCPFVKSC